MNGQPKSARDIFLEAIESVAPDEWPAYLKGACSGDEDLRQRVQVLLNSHQQDDSLFDQAANSDDSFTAIEQPGTVIGPYKLLQQIGEGGFGVVYMAEQLQPVKRKVAVKVIKPGMDTKEVVARFEAERQALAMMDHANIAKVYDGGATESGRPYFVMELVKGIALTDFCDANRLSLKQRLTLFGQVCLAIQHAHQKGVIHRDVKPNNVMVTMHDGVPVPKVIDFGVAKAISQELTEKTMFTAYGQMIGTPQYMSPEQAEMSGLDIDTRSDVYSLGVLLYELLTGTTPLDKQVIQRTAYDELCRQIREMDAPRPSARISTLQAVQLSTIAEQRKIEPQALRQQLSGDLDRVVLKAIEKDRERRYETPKELASDIERFLDDKPVEAVPPSAWYLARKYMRRHKAAILTAATVLSFLVIATVFSTWQALVAISANKMAAEKTNAAVLASQEAKKQANIAEREKLRADEAREDAIAARNLAEQSDENRRRLLYASNMQLADHMWHSGDGTPRKIQELLLAWIPTDEQQDLRDFAWRFQWNRLHFGAEQIAFGTRCVTTSPTDGLIIGDDEGIREWRDTANEFFKHWSGGDIVALSPCGRWAVVHSQTDTQHLQFVDIAARNVIRQVAGTKAAFASNGEYAVAWLPSSEQLVDYHVWKLGSNVDDSPSRTFRGTKTTLNTTPIVSPDGETVVLPYQERWLDVHRLGESEPIRLTSSTQYYCSTWSPNGRLFASGHVAGEIRIRFADDLERVHVVKSSRDEISAISFSRNSQVLAAGGEDGKIDLYDVSQFHSAALALNVTDGDKDELPDINTLDPPKAISSLNAHVQSVQEIVISHDGSKLATRDASGTAKLWKLVGNAALLPPIGYHEYPLSGRGGVWWEDSPNGVRVRKYDPNHQLSGTLSVGDRIVAISDENGFQEIDDETDANQVSRLLLGRHGSVAELRMMDDESQEQVVTIERQLPDDIDRLPLTAIEFTQDTRNLVLATKSGTANQSVSGKVNQFYPASASSVSISPNRRLLALDDQAELVLWDLESDKLIDRLPARVSEFPSPAGSGLGGTVAFSPDGRFLAMGTGIGHADFVRSDLKVWDMETRKEIRAPLFKNKTTITDVVFTPDNDLLIATDRAGVVRIWNTANWEQQEALSGLRSAICVDVSPDSRWLAQGGPNGVAIWDFESREKRHVLREETVGGAVEFSRDGRTLIVAGVDGKAVMWDVKTGTSLATIDTGSDILMDCKVSTDDRKLAICSWAGDLWMWDVASIDQIDQHPLTLKALFEQGKAHNNDGNYAAAEYTLARVLRLHLKYLEPDHWRVENISDELARSLKGRGRFPKISKQPETKQVKLGESVSLSVEVKNEKWLDFTYQWFLNGEAVEGATDPTLSIENVSADQLGKYAVEIGVSWYATISLQSEPAFLVGRDGIAKGGLKKEVFFNIPNGRSRTLEALTDSPRYPHAPDVTSAIGSFELPSNVGDEYGVRITGFLIPPKPGDYVFYVVSDDSSQLFLSPDESPDNKRMIASYTGWNPRWRGWQTLGPESVSSAITLQAAKRYWVEALYKEKRVDDRFAVTWQMPDEPPPKNGDEPIPGKYLEFQLE